MTATLNWLVQTFGYPVAALGILIETLGIPFPGETLMLVVSAYAAQGHLDIRLVILTCAVATIAGADIGYFIGFRGGRPFVERFSRRLRLSQGYLARTEMFFGRFGGLTILFARFVMGLRQWSAIIAGVARMPFWRFQAFTSLGGVFYSTLICLVGFYLGRNLPLLERLFTEVGYVGGALIILLLVAAWFVHRTLRARSLPPTGGR